MSWKETTLMSTRLEFVLLAAQPGANLSALCRGFGISRKTAYKWLERYRLEGQDGLQDHSRRPHTSPSTSPSEIDALILKLHKQYPCWGARKLAALLPEALRPHHSTIDAILRRHGCRVLGAPLKENSPVQRFEHVAPNLLWQMDFKGHFALTDSQAGRCHPLTILDDHSRFGLCLIACTDQRSSTVRQAMTTTFERYGLPERITADNGTPWGTSGRGGLSKLEVWLIRLGIRIGHSRPYHPQTQGKDERFHRTLKLELLARRGFNSIAECQREFDIWRECYNLVRPHEALGQQPPITRYRPSGRRLPSVLPEVEYDTSQPVRKVGSKGYISYNSVPHFVGEGLRDEKVAIAPTATDGIFDVYFCHHRIRSIDTRK